MRLANKLAYKIMFEFIYIQIINPQGILVLILDEEGIKTVLDEVLHKLTTVNYQFGEDGHFGLCIDCLAIIMLYLTIHQ